MGSEFREILKYLDFSHIDNYAKDFGRIISRAPLAVFLPPTVKILQQFLRFVSRCGIKITCRGKGNSAYGQSQIKDGIIIDLKNMDVSLKFNSDDFSSIAVPAFKTWLDIIEFSKQKNKTIPVTVDGLDLTVGGTLSFGGLGGTSYRCGSTADNILSLDVVTVDGKYHTCSETTNKELFDAVLCGRGQFGIIISATIPLLTAKQKVNRHLLSYTNADQFLREQKVLYKAKIFDHLKGLVRKKDGIWEYIIEAASYYDEQEDPRIIDELKKLSPREYIMQTMPYWEFINIVTRFMETLRDIDKLNVPHPWYCVLVPEREIASHLSKALDTSYLTGTEPIIIYPLNSACFKRSLFIKPACRTFYLLGVLYNTSPDATKTFPYQEVLMRNKTLYLDLKDKGGCRYPIDAIPFTAEDWANHYG